MQGDMVGLVAFDFVLRFVLARVVDVSFVIDVLCMHLDDSPADPPGLRVPAYTVVQLESFFHTSTCTEKGATSSGDRPTLSSLFQSDREYCNDLVATIHDDDLVADHKVPESPPLRMDIHDDRGDFDHAYARRHRGAHVDREVDVAGTRYIAAGQDRLSDLGALLRRQADAATRRALLSLTLLGLP